MLFVRIFMCCLALVTMSSTAHAQQSKAPAPFTDNYAEVNGQKLHYATAGKGKMVLFLHGYPAFWYQWKDQMLEMSKTHMAVAPDLRGYNLSSRPEPIDQYQMKLLVEDVKQLAEKLNGKGNKFVLVIHDFGSLVGWVFTMYYPELVEKLIVVNGPNPWVTERELRENPSQRYASNYHFVFNNILAPGEKPMDENDTVESAKKRASGGFVDAEVKAGHYTEEDRQMWIGAWSQPGSTRAGLNYYRANNRNGPFNDLHPKEMVKKSWSAAEMTPGAKSPVVNVPTLVIWGLKDEALLPGNLSGLDKWVSNMWVKLYPENGHWVFIERYKEVNADMRAFIEGKDMRRESVFREKSGDGLSPALK